MEKKVTDTDLAVVEHAAILTRGCFSEVFFLPGSDVGPREGPFVPVLGILSSQKP